MTRWLLPLFLVLVAPPAFAQDLTLSLGEGGSIATQSIQLIALITVLSLAPAVLIMVTAFPFLVTVLSILRQAIGLQQAPPNMLIISLALFLTYFVMEPVFMASWSAGIEPVMNNSMELHDGLVNAIDPFRGFMANRIDVETFMGLAELRPDFDQTVPIVDAPLSVIVPSFLLSEIARAFQIGFLVFLPFLVIDLVVSAILMSMGMMMVPPAVVALPFKLAFFVVSNGWSLLAGSLVRSYM